MSIFIAWVNHTNANSKSVLCYTFLASFTADVIEGHLYAIKTLLNKSKTIGCIEVNLIFDIFPLRFYLHLISFRLDYCFPMAIYSLCLQLIL